jgi:hypothetical protein
MSKSRTSILAAAVLIAAVLVLVSAYPSAAEARSLAKPVGWGPLTSKQAAKLVDRSPWEPRPANRAANHTVPGRAQLDAWRASCRWPRCGIPYARYVNGRFRGTTNEIIQWAAHKWGFQPRLLRAVAAVESWWRQSTVGDQGDSFGLFQFGRPWHCKGNCAIVRNSTPFNADYYGGLLRAYFDGKMKWLNTMERGKRYEPGDIWGSVGAHYAGRWWTNPARQYIQKVKDRMRERPWKGRWF